MQTILYRFWTPFTIFISYNDNHFTGSTSYSPYFFSVDLRFFVEYTDTLILILILWITLTIEFQDIFMHTHTHTHLYITKTIQVRRTRHAGHCWRSNDELISDVFLWTPTHGRTKAGRPARTYIQQLCEDTRCCPEDLPEAMNDREKWRERVRDIRAPSTTWWWWWWWWWL